jgi:hypothetical protein
MRGRTRTRCPRSVRECAVGRARAVQMRIGSQRLERPAAVGVPVAAIAPRRMPTILARAGQFRVRHTHAVRLGSGLVRVRPRISARLRWRIGVLRSSERRAYGGGRGRGGRASHSR